MTWRATNAGLSHIERVETGVSADEQLRGIELHGDYVGSEAAMRYETTVYEATKP